MAWARPRSLCPRGFLCLWHHAHHQLFPKIPYREPADRSSHHLSARHRFAISFLGVDLAIGRLVDRSGPELPDASRRIGGPRHPDPSDGPARFLGNGETGAEGWEKDANG